REDHLLLLTMHHIVTDGWSLAILFRELEALYGAFRAGRPSPLPELPVQYADFALWQRRWLTGAVLERQVAYWRERLAGAPAVLELPADRPRPPVQTLRGGEARTTLPAGLLAGLRGLSRARGVSLFMTLLAGFQTLLGRLGGGADVTVGSPIAGRTRSEVEELIGFFVNTLVFRGDLSGDPAFADLLERTREGALEAFAHQDLPFEKLVEELRPERNLAHSPLFQVMLALQNAPPPRPALPGARAAEPVDAGAIEVAKFDLTLGLVETAEGLAGTLGYNRDLFEPTTVRRLLRHFETLLASAVEDPSRRLSELALLAAAERHQLLSEWNDTAAPDPEEACLHRPFERRAAERPDSVAVVAGGREHLSYGELEARSERLARALAARGVGPGKLVGVHFGRNLGMAVAVLAVEKAGGAYVPLEASWPLERIRWIVAERGVRHLVTEDSRLAAVAELADCGLDWVVRADDPLRAAAAGELVEGSAPLRGPGPEDPAYVIFTSGSTGHPKGVVVRHRPAANLVSWVNRTFGVGPDDRLLFVTALSFDLSVYDLFGILAAGGTVRLATAEELEDPVRQVEILVAERVTFWDSAPAALQRLAPLFPSPQGGPEPAPHPAEPPVAAPALRLVFLSGDWVPLTLPGRVRRSFPGAEVVALGGATEATVWSNVFRVAEVRPEWSSIPYGRPIANARYHVLDRSLRPCPVGVAGDLHIAGGCLSSGYAGSPRQTAESYLPDPFAAPPAGAPGAVLYRTGDRARYFADGNLEFLGRLDTQVKVRGFRIELGEIEAVLVEHPAIAEAVVLAREDTPGDQRLVAYLIPAGEPPAPAELRAWAARKLPEYMLPSAFVARESWPVSATGKLDRKALPPPGAAAADASAVAAVPPRTVLERAIAGVWREVLGVPEVGRDDNFFDLGGHSLLLARVHERLAAELGRELAMVELFRNPTVASLARALGDGDERPAAEPLRMARRSRRAGSRAVAVVGMAGRFPGAADVAALWRNLRSGVESIRTFTDEELLAAGFSPEELADPSLVKARGALDDPDLFDAAFFGYSPREAAVIDPQQRLFLEVSWQALEDAGYGCVGAADRRGGDFAGLAAAEGAARVGVFGGVSESSYLHRLRGDRELVRTLGGHQIAISNNPDFLPARVSYKLSLTGPSVGVQTACSTSLVAVHLACRSLLEGECDLALAGGASVQARETQPYLYQPGGIGSPDGRVRAFDARAAGVVGGSGVGVVALKRLDDALADGDAIRAVVRGSAINNDGGLKAGFTAPSAEGQAAAIRDALEAAGVEPATVGYVEAHGTATPLGDPIEVAGLKRAFANGSSPPGEKTCALGSIKTNLGHLDAAAGVTGLIKAVLALEHREIPPSLHFEAPNPELGLEESPFFVADRLLPWTSNGAPRRAGVSSFGIGGTNAHAVLEEAPRPPRAAPGAGDPEPRAELMVLSARTGSALEQAASRLARHLAERPELALGDVAWTLQVGRRAFPHRLAVVCLAGEAPAPALETFDRRWSWRGVAPEEPPRVAFLFPGQGAQFPAMGEALYREEPVFRAALDHCAEVLEPELGLDLRRVLYGETGGSLEAAEERLAATELAQPALFAVEHALTRLWASWGIEPAAMLGHSLGEYVAAVQAGVFALDDALRLVAARGRMMGSRPGGAMLAVRLGEAELAPRLAAAGSLALAAVNAADACVVSGPAEAVAAFQEGLEADGVGCRRLHTSHAFHSPLMEPVVEPFRELVARLELRPPELPFVSNVTGTWIRPEEATDPGYWARHLRRPVRFAAGLSAIASSEEAAAGWAIVEVGPGRTLTTLARRHPAAVGARALVPSTRHPRQAGSDRERALSALGALWVAGVEVDWRGLHREEGGGIARRRVPLPTYPFERRSFWLGGGPARHAEAPAEA
ncbi:MAG TPA: amino acid adenylation domain-containing protein, partial [Thermoanaerobaculia bacterium]|nr:amino acid adenylation domain-containing protein [Thermoanaerobaculia bacterium]